MERDISGETEKIADTPAKNRTENPQAKAIDAPPHELAGQLVTLKCKELTLPLKKQQ